MAERGFLRWRDGAGWLVYAGGPGELSSVRSQALARATAEGAVAYLSLAEDGGDSLLDDMEDLGAPTGYIVDLMAEDPETIVPLIREAGIVVLEAGVSVDALYELAFGPVMDAIDEAFQRGALILVEGLAVNIFGRWVLSDNGHLLSGMDWVRDGFLEPNASGLEDSRAVQAIIQTEPDAIAISISADSAIALGPDGEVELWGNGRVTVSLGQNYSQASENGSPD